MGKPYSVDLRQRVVATVEREGMSRRAAAAGAQGPVTTGSAPTQPLRVATVKELNRALGTSELVDPARRRRRCARS